MPQSEFPATDLASLSSLKEWPQDWYVFEDGQINGPFKASQLFDSEATETSNLRFNSNNDGAPEGQGLLSERSDRGNPSRMVESGRLISRRGFSQWYPIDDIRHIFTFTTAMDRKAHQAKAELSSSRDRLDASCLAVSKKECKEDLQVEDQAKGSGKFGHPPAVQGRLVGPSLEAKSIQNLGQDVLRSTSSSSNPIELSHWAPTKEQPQLIPKGPIDRSLRSFHGLDATLLSPSRIKAKDFVLHEHFVAKGQLRLGNIRGLWTGGFGLALVTLGFSLIRWFSELSREVGYHTSGLARRSAPPAALISIPILHLLLIHHLAKSIQRMERQNGYQSVSLAKALVLGIIPVFGMMYLQSCANRHWLLHVKQSMTEKARRQTEQTISPRGSANAVNAVAAFRPSHDYSGAVDKVG